MGPDPKTLYPIPGNTDVVFIKNLVKAPNVFIGDYTYFDGRRHGPENFEEYHILYNYDPTRVKLVIGKFCAIAAETRFIMTGDHKLDAITSYPFPIFKQGWESAFDFADVPIKGDIIVGHDVWFGYGCLIKGGVTIGHGSIIAAGAVVVKDVPHYTIVAGNPAKVVKQRFDDATIQRLLDIAWWDWDIEKINRHIKLLCTMDVEGLDRIK